MAAHEFFGESVTGTGGMHAIGFALPLEWPADAAARDDMERKLIGFLAFFAERFESGNDAGSNVVRDPLYRRCMEQLAQGVREHWEVSQRPPIVTRFLKGFAEQNHTSD